MENFYYLTRVDRECMADNEAVIVRIVQDVGVQSEAHKQVSAKR